MVKEKEVLKNRFEIRQQLFDSKVFYRALKEKIEDLGYQFIEKEHSKKDTKYGYELKFKFFGTKKFDDFAKAEVNIEAVFENVNKIKVDGKEVEKGDGTVVISGKILTDYDNKWATSSLKKMLFDVYSNYFMRGNIKKYYTIPTIIDVEELGKTAREKLEFY